MLPLMGRAKRFADPPGIATGPPTCLKRLDGL
jgi:hypothetical protein